MVCASDAHCVDCVSVRKTVQLHLVQNHKESAQDAILRSNDLALFQTVPVDHFATESILTVDNDFVFVSWVKPLRVNLPKFVQQFFVQPEDNKLLVNVFIRCALRVGEVLTCTRLGTESSKVGKKITVELVTFQINRLSHFTEYLLSPRPLQIFGIKFLLTLYFNFFSKASFDILVRNYKLLDDAIFRQQTIRVDFSTDPH